MPAKPIIAADLFCGAGGTSTGLARAAERAGRSLDLTAINHWPVAVETHGLNHPGARHLCETLENVDPRKLFKPGKLDLLVASPECTHHSNARGGKPVDDQSRATAWHVIRWAEALRPRAIMVENVREWESWGPIGSNGQPLKSRRGETFQAWVQALRSLGYSIGHRLLNAADYGAATSRLRLFVFAVRGRGGLRYPEATHARHPTSGLFGTLQRWRAAREVIDWTLPGESIFTRKRPLSANTLKRIEAGLRKFCGEAAEPFLLQLTHGGRLYPLDLPLPTITTAKRGEIGIVQPFISNYHGDKGDGCSRTQSVNNPLPTIDASNRFGLVQPFAVWLKGTGDDQLASTARNIDDPLPTLTGSNNVGVAEPFVVQIRDGHERRTTSVDVPLPTLSSAGAHLGICRPFLVPYYGTGKADSVDDPLRTLTAKDRLGLVQPLAVDIRFRMLQPHELAAGMSFPPEYRFAGTRGDVVRQIGNAVDCKQAEANLAALLGLGDAA